MMITAMSQTENYWGYGKLGQPDAQKMQANQACCKCCDGDLWCFWKWVCQWRRQKMMIEVVIFTIYISYLCFIKEINDGIRIENMIGIVLSTGMNNSKRLFASRWSTRYSNINTNSNARKKTAVKSCAFCLTFEFAINEQIWFQFKYKFQILIVTSLYLELKVAYVEFEFVRIGILFVFIKFDGLQI